MSVKAVAYLHRAVKEAVELDEASRGVRAGRRRLRVLVNASRFAEERVSVAEDDEPGQQGAHEEGGEHAGDEDVHVDHLVGVACLDVPHTYNTSRHWLVTRVRLLRETTPHPTHPAAEMSMFVHEHNHA